MSAQSRHCNLVIGTEKANFFIDKARESGILTVWVPLWVFCLLHLFAYGYAHPPKT
jgi:hypothetical protein